MSLTQEFAELVFQILVVQELVENVHTLPIRKTLRTFVDFH
jgi:hypothetical protein